MEYRAELERVAAFLQSVPGRFSEANIKRLGSLNHFEAFEDEIQGTSGGVRLSLSGSIVVIDIDLVDGRVTTVSVSLAAAAPPTGTLAFMAAENHPEELVLKSLKRHRLDQFARILEFLSRCDRYSTKEVDCFKALDSVAAAIGDAAEMASEKGPFGPFGVPQVNVTRLGVGLWYYGKKDDASRHFALLDVRAGSRKDFALKYRESWFSNGVWEPAGAAASEVHDVRAEFVLTLDPPVLLSRPLATELSAIISNETPTINERRQLASLNIARHKLFSRQQAADEFDVGVANVLPYEIVEVSHIPLTGPEQIPQVLNSLRRFAALDRLVKSVLTGPPMLQSNEIDLSLADALELKDKPFHLKAVAVSVVLEDHGAGPVLNVSVREASALLTVMFTDTGLSVEINKPVNKNDLSKLVNIGRLDLALSYAVGSLGVVHRRSSFSR